MTRIHKIAPRPGSGSFALRRCERCDVRHRALCAGVQFERLGALEAIVSHRRYLPNQAIFEEGGPADYVYNLSGGDVRVYKIMTDGRRQITGFQAPGDFLGLSQRDAYIYGAEAINNVELCCIRVIDLERLMTQMPAVRARLLEMGRDELAAAQEQMLLLGRKSAREKLLSFLLQRLRLDESAATRGAASLDLPMFRADIADFLGMTIETVSRTFAALKDEGLVELVTAQRIVIPDLAAAEAAAGAD